MTSNPILAWEGRVFLERVGAKNPYLAALLCELPLTLSIPADVSNRIERIRADIVDISNNPFLAASLIGLIEDRKGATEMMRE